MMKKCEHGSDGTIDYNGMWCGGISNCDCCGATILYVDSLSGGEYTKSRTWQPKNKCSKCGGKYVDYDSQAK